jgi:methionyl-tRNA formyltransferase
MNIVFFGSAHFGAPALEKLLEKGHTLSCVVTQPDRKRGRGLLLSETRIKTIAKINSIRVFQPERINARESVDVLRSLQADLFVVIAYGQLLSEEVLGIPKLFAVNVHASLLPRYRGAAPINWCLINGNKMAGLSVIKLVKKMDAGPLLLQQEVEIASSDTAFSLEEKLSELAAPMLLEAVTRISRNDYALTGQDESAVTYAPKLKKENGLIHWEKPAEEIHNLIRGCVGWPGAFTCFRKKLLKIHAASVIQNESMSSVGTPSEPATVIAVSKEAIAVATGKDVLLIQKLQIEGKRVMSVKEFTAGHALQAGEKLGKNICIKNKL